MKKVLLLAVMSFCFLNIIYAQAGQLDPSFGNKGLIRSNLGKPYPYGIPQVKQVLLQSNGSTFSIYDSYVTKRHPNGSVDSSFGVEFNEFTANADFTINKAALQPDGKIVVVGSTFNNTEDAGPGEYSNILIERFNADGSPDSSFGNNGKNTFSSDEYGEGGDWNQGYAVAIQNDEKIVVEGSSNFRLALLRYNTNGTLDSTFNGNGFVRSDIPDYNDYGLGSIALQRDGKIVAVGDYLLNRFNTNGSLDSTFAGDGKQTTDTIGWFSSIVIQSDGKIVTGGGNTLARFNTNGELDKTFSGGGKKTTDIYLGSLALQSDGKIVAGGGNTLARFNTKGELDKTFSGDGKQITDSTSNISSLVIENNGKILTAATNSFFRFNTNGSRDKTFGVNGKFTDSIRAGFSIYNSTIVQKDGKIIAAGFTWNGNNLDFAIARYNTDGSLDKTFSGDGVQITDFSSKNDIINAVAMQSDGKIVVAGSSRTNDSSLITVARYNSDGSLDNTFSGDGKQQTVFDGKGEEAKSVAIQNDDKIVVVGAALKKGKDGYFYKNNFVIIRYNKDGSLDKTFDEDGKRRISPLDGYASSVAIQSNGKIVVGGIVNQFIHVDRLNTNGSLDTTFTFPYAKDVYDHDPGNIASMSLAIQKDGKIVLGGNYNNGKPSGTIWGNYVARLNTNGSFDSTFLFQYTTSAYDFPYPASSFGNLIAIQNDGKIVVAGAAFTRYFINGSIDSTFGNNGIQATEVSKKDNFINAIAISANKLYGAGLGNSPHTVGLLAKFLLDSSSNTQPTVTLTAPADNTTRLAPAAHIKLSATAADKDGTITKVEFYSGTKLLHTETVIPYGYVWINVLLGNYTITAKAYDNNGNVTTSAPVHISVVPNKAPIVSIISPADNQTYTDTATIHLEAAASDTDGRITNVKFYNGTTLLRTEFTYPYTYNWTNVPAGTYTITAVAADNWGAYTTSAPVTITVTSARAMIVSNKPVNNKTGIKEKISIKLSPNPATNIVNLYTKGLKQSKPADISIISISGTVLKKVQISGAAQMQIDVSSLAKGVYTIKIISGDKVFYKQFIKL